MTLRALATTAALAVSLVSIGAAAGAHAATSPHVIATIPVGSQPWGVAVSPDGSTAYVSNYAGNTISVITLSSMTVTSTIASISGPLGVAFTPDGTQAYASASGAGAFARIDTATHTVAQTISGGACTTPNNIVANPAGGAMYASCGSNNRGASVNTATQAVNDNLANVTEALNDVAIAPSGSGLIWARGTRIWFQSPGAFVTTSSAPLAVATVQGIDRVFTANPGDGTVSIISNSTQTLLSTITVGGSPQDIVVSNDGATAYVTDGSGGRLVIIDLATETVTASVTVGSSPEQVALTPDGAYALVVNGGSNSISVLDLSVPATGDRVPTAPLQQFARAESDTCERQPADLVDFPALADQVDRAWGMSWAQWPNGGAGGFVCTRQPYYTSRGTWSVQ